MPAFRDTRGMIEIFGKPPVMDAVSLESRVFSLAKDAQCPDENQDAWRIDPAAGIAVLADGVASGIFSRQWAGILAEAALVAPPDFQDRDALQTWLAQRRKEWQDSIDTTGLAWHQKAKLREGAFSTLLWVQFDPRGETGLPPNDGVLDAETGRPLKCYAIGDSCLFVVRHGRMIRSFPVETAQQLQADPLVLGSTDLGRDRLIEFVRLEMACQPGDLIVMCTDGVADWALRLDASGNPPPWKDYWEMSEEAWRNEVERLRATRHMRYDDATLILLRLAEKPAAEPEPPPAEDASGAESPAGAGPPPLPVGQGPVDWRETVNTVSEKLYRQFSPYLAQGVQKLHEARDTATAAIRKYCQKQGQAKPGGPPEDHSPADSKPGGR
jgi:serine/threonine protein phosphatase PrpC